MTHNRRQAAPITVRPAIPTDAPAIGAVFDAAVRASWTYLGDLAHEPMFAAEDWDQLVADHAPPNALLVAEHETGGVAGYTSAHPDDGEMFLLFVDPEHSGRGIGGTLLAAAHESLRAAGCPEAFLFTHEHNERAIAFYSAAGYHPDGKDRTSEFRGTHIREVRLVKQLNPSAAR
jgi:ribosomal protein S18 acetylase RimI-like enzyme